MPTSFWNTPLGELGATGAIGILLGIWAKLRFVSKEAFTDYCTRNEKAADEIKNSQHEIFEKLDKITKHMGAVEQYMKMVSKGEKDG